MPAQFLGVRKNIFLSPLVYFFSEFRLIFFFEFLLFSLKASIKMFFS